MSNVYKCERIVTEDILGKIHQECKKCHVFKGLEEFYSSSNTKNKRMGSCKNCYKTEMKQYNSYKNKIKNSKRSKKIIVDGIVCKNCNFCDKIKDIELFVKNKKGYSGKCLECNKITSQEFRKNNLEKLRERTKKYEKTRQKNLSVNRRLSRNLRQRILSAIKDNRKSDNTFNLLGCSVDFLKKHLESKFLEGMDWANHGSWRIGQSMKWHIDHIKPCASFDLSKPEEQRKCFHWSNLQPLWAIDNLVKSFKY